MDLYEKRILSNIQRFNAYFDIKSYEETTGQTNEKYKLAGRFIPDLSSYPFFVLTKTKEACREVSRFCIAREDWLNRVPGHLELKYSYTDINTKVEVLEIPDILSKIRDPENQFKKVARLCKKKCNEMQNMLIKNRKVIKRMKPETRKIVALGILEDGDIGMDNLKRIGIL